LWCVDSDSSKRSFKLITIHVQPESGGIGIGIGMHVQSISTPPLPRADKRCIITYYTYPPHVITNYTYPLDITNNI